MVLGLKFTVALDLVVLVYPCPGVPKEPKLAELAQNTVEYDKIRD